jgi:CRP-like cAMP-binding protein
MVMKSRPQNRAFDQFNLGKLRKFQNLGLVSPEKLEEISKSLNVERFRRHAPIPVQQDFVYIVLTGAVKCSAQISEAPHLSSIRQRPLINLIPPGDFFGYNMFGSFPGHLGVNLSFEAFADCRIGKVSSVSFVEALVGMPFKRIAEVMSLFDSGVWLLTLRCLSALAEDVRTRMETALVVLGSQFGITDSRGTVLTVNLTYNDLADFIGCSRRRAIQIMEAFEKQGLIIRSGRQLVLSKALVSESLYPKQQFRQTPIESPRLTRLNKPRNGRTAA